jgi:hypothetical protein
MADQRFDVSGVAIVGRELEYVEHVRGRLTYWGAAWRGAAAGVLTGALAGAAVRAVLKVTPPAHLIDSAAAESHRFPRRAASPVPRNSSSGSVELAARIQTPPDRCFI